MSIESLEALEKLVAALAANLPPSIPIHQDVWSTKEIAAYLKVSDSQVRERYACLPDFPKPYRLPKDGGGVGRPRWKAKDIVAWFEQYRDKN
jgi:predicted DNA-binding transcriptional regulator AlpA